MGVEAGEASGRRENTSGVRVNGEEGTRAWKLADFISRISNPLYVSPPVILAVSLRHSPSIAAAFGWWGFYQIFSAAIPLADLIWRRRTGRISDWHISRREERKWPMVCGLLYAAAGCLAFWLLPAPRILLACMLAGLAQGIISLVVTLYWKISLHLMGSSSLAVILYLSFDLEPWNIVSLIMLAYLLAVGLSRYILRAHTATQVIAGTLVGAAVTWLVFFLTGVPS